MTDALQLDRPYGGKVPEFVDKTRLCFETCSSDTTVDMWVRTGVIPPGKKRAGKLMWRWATVVDWLENGKPGAQPDGAQDNERDVAFERAQQETRRAR